MAHRAKTRIMVFGTFDILHKGHLEFFRQARGLSSNPFLIVSVARDKNVNKIKGAIPLNKEKSRLEAVKKLGVADKTVLGSANNYLSHIIKEKPDIIALGYDQKAYTENLKKLLERKGLLVKIFRLKPHKAHIYKSSFLKDSGSLRKK